MANEEDKKESRVNKWSNIGSAISVWGKLLIGLFIFVFTVGTAWYQIETNASDNLRQDEQFKTIMENQQSQFEQIMNTVTKEFAIQGDRADKRYHRLVEEDEKNEAHDDKQDEQLLELSKELWYLKGKLDEKDRK